MSIEVSCLKINTVVGWKNIKERIQQKTGYCITEKTAKIIRDRRTEELDAKEQEELKMILDSYNYLLDGDEIDTRISMFNFVISMDSK